MRAGAPDESPRTRARRELYDEGERIVAQNEAKKQRTSVVPPPPGGELSGKGKVVEGDDVDMELEDDYPIQPPQSRTVRVCLHPNYIKDLD
jgi:hypothetical protein